MLDYATKGIIENKYFWCSLAFHVDIHEQVHLQTHVYITHAHTYTPVHLKAHYTLYTHSNTLANRCIHCIHMCENTYKHLCVSHSHMWIDINDTKNEKPTYSIFHYTIIFQNSQVFKYKTLKYTSPRKYIVEKKKVLW